MGVCEEGNYFSLSLALPARHSTILSIAHSRTIIHFLRCSGHALLRAGQHPEDIHVPPRPQAPGALGITFLQNSFVWECQSRCPSAAWTASALEPSACAHCHCSWHGPTCSEISVQSTELGSRNKTRMTQNLARFSAASPLLAC